MLRDFKLARIAPKENMLDAYMALYIEKINHEIVRLIRIECYRTQRIDL